MLWHTEFHSTSPASVTEWCFFFEFVLDFDCSFCGMLYQDMLFAVPGVWFEPLRLYCYGGSASRLATVETGEGLKDTESGGWMTLIALVDHTYQVY